MAQNPLAALSVWVAYNRVFGVLDHTDSHLMRAEANELDKTRGRYAVSAYEKWFEARRDWMTDEGDRAGMRWMLKSILNSGVVVTRRHLTTLRDYLPDTQVENWYVRYAMFDPTMGMYNPTEARDFYLQRMTKRFNLLVQAIEEGAR